MIADLQKIWQQAYSVVPAQLARIGEINCAATAFNTNIDAVVKISGAKITELAQDTDLTAADLQNPINHLNTPKDVVRGVIKCFAAGIAEEWLCEDKAVFDWMHTHLGYDRLQMGGQAGIIANVLAVLGVRQVYVHSASHPQIQAEQFVDSNNLLAFDENNKIGKARQINRPQDEPLIHQIIEFSAGDSFTLADKTYICPRDNRFIATYDTANLELKINNAFVQHLNQFGFDYLLLSGFHNLTDEHGGLQRLAEIIPLLQHWKQSNPHGIIHLELASTQDKLVRRAILEKLAPLADSLGLNEREALDALEICAPQMFTDIKNQKLTPPLLLQILQTLKHKLRTPRIQLHFLGTYLTLQNKDLSITPAQSRNGMLLAATIAASKAGLGNIESKENLLWAHGHSVAPQAIENLCTLATYLDNQEFAATGITSFDGFDLIAIPTILVDKPLTLVGMGDTISSISLLGAR